MPQQVSSSALISSSNARVAGHACEDAVISLKLLAALERETHKCCSIWTTLPRHISAQRYQHPLEWPSARATGACHCAAAAAPAADIRPYF